MTKEIPEGRGSTSAGALVIGSPSAKACDSNPRGAALGRVGHWKRDKCDVYIGRPTHWGNPYLIGQHGTREEVIAKYEARMRERLADPVMGDRWRMMLKDLRGKVLGCWCAPQACHGDVLLKLAGELCGDNASP